VGTLVNFLEALIISWVIVLGAYCIALLAMRSVWWTIRFASWAILYATFGVTLLILRSIALSQGVRLRYVGRQKGRDRPFTSSPNNPNFPTL
jgi:hypothetical protein